MTDYQRPTSSRRESRTVVGRFRGGKLSPVMAVPIRGNEGGMVSQAITLELDPIAGRMITPITGEFISVFVPVEAIDAIKDPAAAYAGMREVIREKLLSGNPLFGLENEGEISKRCGVNPRSVGGVKKVNEMIRLAHNAAVNHLRQKRYVLAAQLLAANTGVTPALVSRTVLEAMNAVLDPDDRINGAVDLQLPNLTLPVEGVHFQSGVTPVNTQTSIVDLTASAKPNSDFRFLTADTNRVRPLVFAKLNNVTAGNVSLTDFYNAEKMDKLTREMRQIVDDNPDYGEEMVLRWAHGLSVDAGRVPFVIHEEQQIFGRSIVGATDSAGVANEVVRSDMLLEMRFSVPVPRTELGGIVVTFATIKPDEKFGDQPHPYLSDVWGLDNFVADEMALDPVPVTMRQLDAGIAAGSENTVAFYTGLNALKAFYLDYGLSRQLDPNTIANKTAVWQYKVPLSVTPQSPIYPNTISHYPFADQLAEVCTYTITSQTVLQTPTIFGPSPVETLAILNGNEII